MPWSRPGVVSTSWPRKMWPSKGNTSFSDSLLLRILRGAVKRDLLQGFASRPKPVVGALDGVLDAVSDKTFGRDPWFDVHLRGRPDRVLLEFRERNLDTIPHGQVD